MSAAQNCQMISMQKRLQITIVRFDADKLNILVVGCDIKEMMKCKMCHFLEHG